MDNLKIYSSETILSFVNKRDGETKLGEKVKTVVSLAEIQQSAAKFVLLGIPEDIGIRANDGVAGAKTAWKAALSVLMNIQSNSFISGEEILVLGHLEIEEPTVQSIDGLRNRVAEIDELVHPVIQKIVATGKIPIVIGGGHNNAFPIIKGVSLAIEKPINVVNIDAHADLRNTAEGRHSGNGFSFAMEKGYLNEYRIFGLQQNYVNNKLPAYFRESQQIKVAYFEDLLLSEVSIVENWADFTLAFPSPCGLEIDLDSIENVLSSAASPTGFLLNDIRKILLSNKKDFAYLHICEGATELEDGRKDMATGKTIAHLVSDFIKALLPHIYPQPSSSL